MPNYEFRCQSCQKQFMKSLPFGSKEVPACPVCMGATKRLISPPMVHFKGSGFYKTDSSEQPKKETPETPQKAPPAKPAATPAPTCGEPSRTTSPKNP